MFFRFINFIVGLFGYTLSMKAGLPRQGEQLPALKSEQGTERRSNLIVVDFANGRRSRATVRQTGVQRLQFDFVPEAIERLEVLRVAIGADDYAEVVRQGLIRLDREYL